MSRKLSIDTNDTSLPNSGHHMTRSIFYAQVSAAKREGQSLDSNGCKEQEMHGKKLTENKDWYHGKSDRRRSRSDTLRINRSLSNPGSNQLDVAMRSDCGLSRIADLNLVNKQGEYSQLVIKLSTHSEENVVSSFLLQKNGGSIGKGEENSICIPDDNSLENYAHATIVYQNGCFYLIDGNKKSGTYIRLSNKVGDEDISLLWPLLHGSRFRVGYSEFEVLQSQEIVAVAGKLMGLRVKLDPNSITTIGRSTENTIHTGDGELSRYHSKIHFDPKNDRYFLEDVGSTNGSFMLLAGPYGKPYRLAYGDQLLVGKTCLSINRFDFGVYANIGVRRTMEDMHAIVQDMRIDSLSALRLGPQSFYGVFDGHGGAETSDYIGENLHKNLAQDLDDAMKKLNDSISQDELHSHIEKTIIASFERTDEDFLATSMRPQAGSTATTALIMGKKLVVANVGDSRTILSSNGKAIRLSNDHKPDREDESTRIRNAGGFVIHSRVMGELAVSRAFGDSDFKICNLLENEEGIPPNFISQALVICRAEVSIMELSEYDEFLVLACDGLFDVLQDQQVVDYIRADLKSHHNVQRAAESIVDYAINTLGSRDNVTVIIVKLN